MRVLVTGHNGYIGSILVPLLQQAGHEVTGLDTYWFDACTLGPGARDVGSFRVDVREAGPEHVEGFDAVIHLAALSNDPLGNLAPEHTYAINHEASTRLARLARDAGVGRFLYSSTCSVYGVAGDEALDENAVMRPVTPYAVSKVKVEEDLHEMADDDFTPVYLRNATVYGYSPRLRVDIVLNNLVAWAHLTGEVRVLSDGTPWRPIAHVHDIATAFVAALEADRDVVHDQAFNVGRDIENYRVREIADIVGETVPECSVVITGETGGDDRSYRVDFSKITERLPAWKPEWDARRGAAELYDAYRNYGLTMESFQRSFTRLARLEQLQRDGKLSEDLRWQDAASG